MTDFSASNWDKLALATGKVTLVWSAIHGWIEIMFSHFSEMPVEKAEAIFFEIRNDRTQRAMVMKLIKRSAHKRQDLIDELEKLFDRIDRQSKQRNSATHLLWQRIQWSENKENDRAHTMIRSPHPLRTASWERDISDEIIAQMRDLAKNLEETEALVLDLWQRLLEHSLEERIAKAKDQK
ncbi:MAG: hypothetical protein ACK4M6_00070 [Hyphomonas sp.]